MKKETAVLLITAGLFLSGRVLAVLSGSGTEGEPYLIQSLADFDEFAGNPSYWAGGIYAKLMCDLNLAGRTYTQAVIAPDTSTDSGFQGTAYAGIFEGDGHILLNLTINAPTQDYIGLFGYVSPGGQIRNLGVENGNIQSGDLFVGGLAGRNEGTLAGCYVTGGVTGGQASGGLVGYNQGGNLTSCYTACSVTGKGAYYTGGMVGYNVGGVLRSCYASGMVTGKYDVGGLVGYNEEGILYFCYAAGRVIGEYNYVGGLVGNHHNGTLTNCYAAGPVTGGRYVGGLTGDNYTGTLTACYASGAVQGSSFVGGLAGSNGGTLTSCYATGSVTGKFGGGLVGYNYGPLTACYAAGAVTGSSPVGGLAAWNASGTIASCFWDIETSGQTASAGGMGKTTAEMKTLLTFLSSGWDFTNEAANGTNDIWRMCVDGLDYPRLNWERTRGDFACPDGVRLEDLLFYTGKWLMNTCTIANLFCGGADFNASGVVDFADWVIFAEHWLEGI
ncbi:MAG TPA: GLUG motif-containing protein [Anaerohalosphaeraceae bacterium]|nr:GLUG motif-containing protein [Anaerohalosphaeraceae bacterium]HOL89473.1 GLUG motif-containing protein [Anaerohalosphaeraceae bacterium]HPP55256.1 GLUG motif-containing protein [Anaerohalosphaeraceae bacterium]